MLKLLAVFLHSEGKKKFRNKKSGFIIKERAFFTDNYTDTVSFLPHTALNTLSVSEQSLFEWVSKFLHCLDWESGDYPYCYLREICRSIVLCFPLSNQNFIRKGRKKQRLCRNYIRKLNAPREPAISKKTKICCCIERH